MSEDSQQKSSLPSGESWLSMSEASPLTPYSTEYLSLLARKGKLPSKKIQNTWYTTKLAVDEYMKKISTATKAVAEKSGFSLVVDKGSEQTVKIVIYNKDTIDLTDQVIKEFDRTNSK